MKSSDYNFKKTNIKGKDYVDVHERLRYLHDEFYGNYSLFTEYQFMVEMKMFICKATLKMQFEGMERTYTGHAQEVIGDGYINKTSALENCETSAVGRACAMAGIGVIDSVASVDEITKAKNREKQPSKKEVKKRKITDEKFTDAVKYLKDGGKLEDVKRKYEIDEDTEFKLITASES